MKGSLENLLVDTGAERVNDYVKVAFTDGIPIFYT